MTRILSICLTVVLPHCPSESAIIQLQCKFPEEQALGIARCKSMQAWTVHFEAASPFPVLQLVAQCTPLLQPFPNRCSCSSGTARLAIFSIRISSQNALVHPLAVGPGEEEVRPHAAGRKRLQPQHGPAATTLTPFPSLKGGSVSLRMASKELRGQPEGVPK